MQIMFLTFAAVLAVVLGTAALTAARQAATPLRTSRSTRPVTAEPPTAMGNTTIRA